MSTLERIMIFFEEKHDSDDDRREILFLATNKAFNIDRSKEQKEKAEEGGFETIFKTFNARWT